MILNVPTYTVRHNASISTAEVLIDVRVAAGVPLVPIKAWVTADLDETVQQLRCALRHYDTQGSTGTSLTIDVHQAGFGAAQATAFYAPGTDPTTLLDTLDSRGCAITPGNGYEWVRDPDESWIITAANSLALELLDAPTAAIALSWGLVFAELRA